MKKVLIYTIALIVGMIVMGCSSQQAKISLPPVTVWSLDSVEDDTVDAEAIRAEYFHYDEEYVEYSMELIDKWQKEENNEKDRYNDKVLYGDWFMPHTAACPNVFFRKDRTFSMWDIDGKHDVYITGSYSIKGDSVYLKCKSGQTISLRYWDGNVGDGNMYLSKGDDNTGWR